MDRYIVLERGRRAGNILLAKVLVTFALSLPKVLDMFDAEELFTAIITFVIAGLFAVLFSFLLIKPLKTDSIKEIRTIYIILACLSVLNLYSYFTEGSSVDAILGLLGTAVYGLVIIALYNPGKPGMLLCYCAAGLSLISALLSFAGTDYDFPNFVNNIFSVVYYVFLGLYIESKEPKVEKLRSRTESPVRSPNEQPINSGSKYDDLIKLKELMDADIITPAEYEAKKKQILGL